MGQKRRIYCKFCDFFCYSPDDYVSHIEKHHSEMIPPDMTPWQFTHYLRTGTAHGSCIVCKKDTSWNDVTHRYERLCNNPVCKEKYKELFKNRMIGKYGKTHLLNDPEQQKKMLANRKISGKYIWSDRVHFFSYTGSYEKEFLEFLDHMMNFDPNDIMAPSPHTYYYEYNGEKHFYIPDFFIPSLDLEIEIKDGGSNANTHPDIVAVNKVKEKLKDEVMMKNHFNYLKICDKQHMKFLQYLEKAKENFIDKTDKPIYMIEKELTLDDLNTLYTESMIVESSEDNSMIKTLDFPSPKAIEYLKRDKECSRYIDTLIKDCVGEVLINEENDELVGYAFVYNKKHKDYGFIFNVFLIKKYRGRGLGQKLVTDVIHKYHGVDLTVDKDNTHAIELYRKNNFVIIKNDNTDQYYMKLKSKVDKDDEVITESVNLSTKRVSLLCKRWSTKNKEQNQSLDVFWDIVNKYTEENGIKDSDICAYGTDWTGYGTDFLYGVFFRNGDIPNDLYKAVHEKISDIEIKHNFIIPGKFDGSKSCKLEDCDKTYDEIWDKGFLSYELEEYPKSGYMKINYKYEFRYTKNRPKPKAGIVASLSDYFKNPEAYTESVADLKSAESNDIYHNLDLWESGECNLLWVTGLSGSGKSTISKEIAKEYNAERIECDDLIRVKRGKHTDGDIDVINHYIDYCGGLKNVFSYAKPSGKNGELMWKDIMGAEIQWETNEACDKEHEKFFNFVIDYAKKHKNKKFIIEGAQIAFYASTFDNLIDKLTKYPVIIKMNGPLKTEFRRESRLINHEKEKGTEFKTIFKKVSKRVVNFIKNNFYKTDWDNLKDFKSAIGESVETDEIVEEACKDPRTARELAQKVKDLAKTYDANFFFVTDGASTTNNNGNPAVQTAREAVAKWEREHGFDDVENWGKNPNDFSQYHLARYTKADVEKIIKRIHDKTVKDKKEPTGNQNCLLCTWCLEANLRGIDILPRAVYSPSDKIFSFDAISIFKNPKKEKFSNIEKFKSIVLNGGDNSRFYVHVNWKGSSGGHEFLVLNLSDKVYVADAQAGILHDIDSKCGKKYFTDINFSNSYTARVDQLILDKKYLEYNDKKYQLEWDDERDSKLVGESVYDPPMSLDDIKQNYGEELYKKLSSDPVHKWRAETGIELVHKEPSKQELIRIWNNWKAMPKDKQKISDKKSLELYGCTNEENYNKLIKSYTESVNDEYTTEASLVFNKSDLCKDIDKFESGKSNVLLVTGFSGSGKSTLAQELASKYNAKHIELDVLDMYNQDIDIEDLEKNEPALYAFINSHKKEDLTYSKYIPFVINWCKKHKDQKFIIEGLQLYDTFDEKNPQSYYNNPIIIKGTSALISTLRAYKRNNEYNKDHKGSLQLDGFKNLLKWVLKDVKSVKKLEQYVRN